MDIFSFLQSITFLDVVKLLIVTLLAVYALFAFLMMRQVAAMIKAVTMQDDYIISVLGLIRFVFAILLLVFALLL